MGAFGNLMNFIFGNKAEKTAQPSKLSTLNIFSPTFSGEARAELNATFVSAVNAHARYIGKIKPEAYRSGEKASGRQSLERLLGMRPNRMQNASQFWRAVAKSYFTCNAAVIWPIRDPSNYREPISELWLLDADTLKFCVSERGEVAVEFTLQGKTYYELMEDLIVLQRETNASDIIAKRSPSINPSLQAIQTTYEGLEQAIRMSQYIRFIMQSSTPVSDDTLGKREERLGKSLRENRNGVMYVNAGETYHEVTSNGKWPLAPEISLVKDDIYEYQGITPEIVKGKFTEDEWQAYYESSIEPFCIELGQELTNKLFTKDEINRGNEIRITTDPLQTASLNTRIKIAQVMLSLPTVVPNNIARLLHQPVIEGGDEPQANLNWVKASEQSQYQTGQEDDNENPPSEEDEEEVENNV